MCSHVISRIYFDTGACTTMLLNLGYPKVASVILSRLQVETLRWRGKAVECSVVFRVGTGFNLESSDFKIDTYDNRCSSQKPIRAPRIEPLNCWAHWKIANKLLNFIKLYFCWLFCTAWLPESGSVRMAVVDCFRVHTNHGIAFDRLHCLFCKILMTNCRRVNFSLSTQSIGPVNGSVGELISLHSNVNSTYQQCWHFKI